MEKHQGEEKIHTISDTTNKINGDDEKSRMRECRWFDDFTVHTKAVSRLWMLPFAVINLSVIILRWYKQYQRLAAVLCSHPSTSPVGDNQFASPIVCSRRK